MSACILAGNPAFSQSLSVQLESPTYHSYNLHCFGDQSGSINLTVTGGTPPYTYHWSNNATTQNISNLAAGYYAVTVTDDVNNTAQGQITLGEPRQLTVDGSAYEYPNHFNVSCYDCYNGCINIFVAGGVPPYSYLWSDGPEDQDREMLGGGNYDVLVEDLNGCTVNSQRFYLDAPARSDWTLTGNAGTNTSSHFIGTTDQTDVVFKSNSIELLRLKSTGALKISALGSNSAGLLYIDNNGILGSGNLLYGPNNPIPTLPVPWFTQGNYITPYGTPSSFLGTTNTYPLDIRTNNLTRMFIDANTGKVGIGTTTPYATLDVAVTDEYDGININQTGSNTRSEIKFSDGNGNEEWAVGSNYYNNSAAPSFFIWNQALQVPEISLYISGLTGKVGIGCIPPTTTLGNYRLYVEQGIMTRDVKVISSTFSDYVFKSGYHLPSLSELEVFIKKNKHLPDIPSEADIQKTGGFELGDMQKKLVKKIEEMTLYILQQQKKIDELNNRVKLLELTK